MRYTIEQVRKLCGISQKQMAEDIKMNLPTYIKKEQGESRFYLDEAINIVEVCQSKYSIDVSINDIDPKPMKH